MSREHELILELRAARRTVREAEIQEQEARVKVAERKAARMKAAAAVEEILAEMDGTSDRPLIDAINGRAREEPESADERQRGYTVTTGGGDKPAGGFDPPGKPTSEGRKKEGGGRKQLNSPPSSDLRPPTSKKERADRREVVISPDGPIRQEEYVGPDVDESPQPCRSRKQILEVLRQIWPASEPEPVPTAADRPPARKRGRKAVEV